LRVAEEGLKNILGPGALLHQQQQQQYSHSSHSHTEVQTTQINTDKISNINTTSNKSVSIPPRRVSTVSKKDVPPGSPVSESKVSDTSLPVSIPDSVASLSSSQSTSTTSTTSTPTSTTSTTTAAIDASSTVSTSTEENIIRIYPSHMLSSSAGSSSSIS